MSMAEVSNLVLALFVLVQAVNMHFLRTRSERLERAYRIIFEMHVDRIEALEQKA
jgi:hypothetical protein